MDIRTLLADELDRRRARNPRYSLRAFARHLGTHHSSVLRIIQGGGRVTARRIEELGSRLGLGAKDLADARLHENSERLAALVRRPGFRPDARWIATRTGLSIDDVNVALHQLVSSRRLVMTAARGWHLESAR